jgi:hypothetical protein
MLTDLTNYLRGIIQPQAANEGGKSQPEAYQFLVKL